MKFSRKQIDELANRFFGAVESGDIETFVSCYGPDARIWHSRDEADTDVQQNREMQEMFKARVKNRRFEIVSRNIFDGGFVQEHVVHGIMPDGSAMRLPVLLIAHLDNSGLFNRISEYFDSAKSPMAGLQQRHVPI